MEVRKVKNKRVVVFLIKHNAKLLHVYVGEDDRLIFVFDNSNDEVTRLIDLYWNGTMPSHSFINEN